MALTINVETGFAHKAVLQVVSHVWDVGKSQPFASQYLNADSYGNKYLYPGMVVCDDPSAKMWVPLGSTGGSYGAYSYPSYAAGIVHLFSDHTFESQVIAPATRAAVIEAHCYLHGGTLGSVPDSVKQASGMKLVQWD